MTYKLTDPEVFAHKTALHVGVLVSGVILDQFLSAVFSREDRDWFNSSEDKQWFIEHCEQRFRYFHANSEGWRQMLENKNKKIDSRKQAKVWILHWLQAFVKNPKQYKERHNTVWRETQ